MTDTAIEMANVTLIPTQTFKEMLKINNKYGNDNDHSNIWTLPFLLIGYQP